MGIITGSEGLLGVIRGHGADSAEAGDRARADVGLARSRRPGSAGRGSSGAGIIQRHGNDDGRLSTPPKPSSMPAIPLDVEALLIIELDGPGSRSMN